MRIVLAALATLIALPAVAQETAKPGPSAEARLQAAYKKEFAFLQAEKATLDRRLGQIQRAAADEERKARVELEVLQRRLIALTVEADQLGETLIELERQADVGAEGLDALDGLVQQMARGFEGADIEWPPPALALTAAKAPAEPSTPAENAPETGKDSAETPDDATAKAEAAPPTDAAPAATVERYAALLSDGYRRAGDLASRLGSVRTEQGRFFLADGKPVEGMLIRVGGVAVYGVSDKTAGALTPAGGGRFKLDPPQGEATARALAAGKPPPTAEVFLYESAAENYEPRQAKTPIEVVRAGGAIAWVIVGLGAFGLLLILLRALLLLIARSPTESLLKAVEPAVRQKRYAAAADALAAHRGAGARVMAAVARTLGADREDIERVFAERMLREEGRIDRFGSALLVIAAVAPLLGLLGTVTGMISTFDVITEHGTGNPKLLSGGISEALITTELGLIVAIPTLLLGNLLNGWASGLKAQIEQGALRLVNLARVGDPTQPPESGAREAAEAEAPEPAPQSAPQPAGQPAPVPAS